VTTVAGGAEPAPEHRVARAAGHLVLPQDLLLRHGDWATLSEPALMVRRLVFQSEQQVAAMYDEDGHDSECTHIVIADAEAGLPLGTSRLRGSQLGRLAVVPEARKQGLGFLLVSAMLRIAFLEGYSSVWANTQPDALGLARIFGFTIEPEEFMLAGRPHYKVFKELRPAISTPGEPHE
jgi:predicted GNAT family N-acyltransferase